MKWVPFSVVGYVSMAGFCWSGYEPVISLKRWNTELIGVSVKHCLYIRANPWSNLAEDICCHDGDVPCFPQSLRANTRVVLRQATITTESFTIHHSQSFYYSRVEMTTS